MYCARFAAALTLVLLLAGCKEMACEAGCEEESSDCLDNPQAYTLGACAHDQGAKPNACQKQFCKDLRDQCIRDCQTTELSR